MSLVSAIIAPLNISNAIKKASQATGADFSYLLKTAARESAFKSGAKAKTSSAAGLFQFIESTWLKTVKEAGNKFGLDKYTPHIFTTRSGRHYVPNQKLRQEILQLRHNPEVSAVMAGAFTQKNSEFVASELGREPTPGELYIAHFLGPKGASDLISLAEKRPNARADRQFPRAARANKSIFYSRGRPRSAAQVYKVLVSDHAKLQAVAAHPIDATPKADNPKIATASAANTAITKPVRAAQAAVPRGNADAVSRFPLAQNTDTGRSGNVNVQESIGLLGQKGSPIAAMTKVASLAQGSLAAPSKTTSDAVLGSIGIWTTSVRPPTDTAPSAGKSPNPAARANQEEPAPVRRRAAGHRHSSRSDRLLEVSARRNAERATLRTASAGDPFRSKNFWDLLDVK